jgi:AhpD family alkylhydroperoxidase
MPAVPTPKIKIIFGQNERWFPSAVTLCRAVASGGRNPRNGKETTMEARLNLYGNAFAAKFAKCINSAGAVVTGSTLPPVTQELVKIRASQINGCAACADMHTKDAAHAGESQVRLNLVAVWREATVFTEAERAALELTEQGTRIADAAGGITDEAWADAAKHHDDDQLAALVSLIALINTYNRMNVIVRQPAGDYQPGQWG